MALKQGYQPGITATNIKDAAPNKKDPKYYTLTGEPRKNNAGRKQMPDEVKKQKVNIAMTNAEHERAIELQKRNGYTSLSSYIVSLINKEYNK